MIRAVAIYLLVICSMGAAFRGNTFRPAVQMRRFAEEKPTDLVPVDKVNVENAASVTSGVLGLILAGPLGAVIFAAIGKYASKKENEAGEALRGVGKSVVEIYNYVSKLNTKFQITEKITESVTKATESSSNEAVGSVKSAVSKISDINKEYDLVSKGKQAVEVAATLSESALEKLEELNVKYDFVESTKKAATVAVNKIREQVNKDN